MPIRGLPLVEEFSDRTDLLETIRRSTHNIVGVRKNDGQLVGYYRVIDILTATQLPELQPIPTLLAEQSHISALTQMQSQHTDLARVVDQRGNQIGIVTFRRLAELMLNRA
jgi:CBS domain containing-hemolysin-like protein